MIQAFRSVIPGRIVTPPGKSVSIEFARFQILFGVLVFAVFFAPLGAQAQAAITGIQVSASPAIVGQPVTITVQGTGTCPVTLYLDEAIGGIPYVQLRDGNLPKSIQHAYQRPGVFHLNAQPQYGYKSCSGNVRLNLQVVGSAGSGGRGPAPPPAPVPAPPSGGPRHDICKQGFVWREAQISDHVCVTPQTRARTRAENYAGGRTTVPGSDVCKQGYVWREAVPTDHICVTPQSRTVAADDNRHAAERRMN